ncbi:ligand-binding protein SH3 [Hahella sp. CCB-MM4]|uniref:SH3 domain-containing protein n=1 Tax=Hahella sp. (strain CCB-MM4) TaxID=1926491 RepID=UPI000B9A74C6|nr:SH3 domain-containing protein [Hahella sp. CCB-MM4]OZG72451.1 ligand-binding protein SH3 [Hahella sp. CCB-MM4]
MMGAVTATHLNVRSQPNTNSRILGEIASGTLVEVVGQKSGWFEIQYQGRPAFVYGDYIQLDNDIPRQIGVVTASLLNVRSRPAVSAEVIGTLGSGTVVPVVSSQSGWLEIPFHGSLGYCSASYIELHRQGQRRQGVVSASLLNVRSNPTSEAPVLGQLRRQAEITVESTLGAWHEISFNNSRGYVAAQYIKLLPEKEVTPSIPIAANELDEALSSDAVTAPVGGDQRFSPANQLPVSGSAEERKVASTWNKYGGLLAQLSDTEGVDEACSVAVLCVESSGEGFDPDNQNRMVIRFENHKFWKYWGKTDPARYRQHFTYDANQVWKGHQWRKSPGDHWQIFHGIQKAEWEVLEFARSIDNDAALMSISMGGPQIMGFNYEALGFRSVQEMYNAFSADMGAQITGMFDFMSAAMIRYLQVLNFVGFAGLYNGSGQKDIYGRRIKNFYDAFKRIS